MSRINELIRALCPEGVKFIPLGEALRNFDSKRRPITKSDRQGGEYPYYGANGIQDYVADYIFDGTFLLVGEDGSVKKSDGRPVLNWATGRIWVNNHAHVLQSIRDDLDLRFVYFYLQTVDISALVTGGTQPKLNQKSMNSISLAVPPLEVQREIVRILDQFSLLEAELGSELEAELEARQKQYGYYRDWLISAVDGQAVSMGELGTFMRGRRFTKNDVVDEGVPSIHYGEIYTDYGVSASHAKRKVRSDMAGQLRYAQPRDVIFAGVGETVEDVGKAVAWLGSEPVAVHDDTFSFTSELDPKYVAYAVQTRDFHSQKANHVARGKVKRLSATGLAKITIPVPNVAEQKRIVAVLDAFDALINGLSIGLFTELAARRKQYEYYRDKLLTFSEVAS